MAIAYPSSSAFDAAADTGRCRIVEGRNAASLTICGAWILHYAAGFDEQLRRFAGDATAAVTIDLAGLTRLDTVGAWLLTRTADALTRRGINVVWHAVPDDLHPLLTLIAKQPHERPLPQPRRLGAGDTLERIGRTTTAFAVEGLALLDFFGRVAVDSLATFRHPSRLRFAAILMQIQAAGVNALPILGLLSFLIGVIMAYQGAAQFHRYGADIYTVNLISIVAMREIGVMMTAIIVAGRSGSAFTAELGVMVVDQEIDALETMGLNLVQVLIQPRLLALIIAMPLLTFFANFMCILGGAITCFLALHIPFDAFLHQLRGATYGWSFWLGLMKAPIFGVLIATVGCLEGLRVERNAASVGRLTTRAVVESLFLVMLVDALFSIAFQALNI